MTLILQMIPLLINASIFLVVFALGLKTREGDALFLLSQPGLLVRSVLSMNILMPLVAITAAYLLDLALPIEIALIALAISPVPPILPTKQGKAGGSMSYAISLLVAASLIAIVLAPMAVSLIGSLFERQVDISPARVAKIVFISVIVPLTLGIVVRMLVPNGAAKIAGPVSKTGSALLALAALPIIVATAPQIWTLIGNGVLITLVAFTLIGLLIGHLLGGPTAENRAVLALATSTRHPGVALAIANLNFPEEKVVLAVIAYHLVVGAVFSLPYVKWQRSAAARVGEAHP